ncbi:MAG: aconitase family protein, partial [Candidatus Nitrosocaldaceae archaeon]
MSKLEINEKNIPYYDVSKYSWMPYTARIILESIIRNLDNKSITQDDLSNMIDWNPNNPKAVSFKVARVIMQDYTGVPALIDLALMRDIIIKYGLDAKTINPLVETDLVIDHSIQVDYWNRIDAFDMNLKLEIERNKERYKFLKWAERSFNNFRLFPPGSGIIHQINLEHIAKVVILNNNAYFDTVLGMDSHTTMINALGILGWGVGGIEAEAAMLGEAINIIPRIIGVKLYNKPREGVTATDIVLTLTKVLREHNVVDNFIEYFGEVDSLTVADRATISNMAPEYGATAALFPVDDQTINYLRLTGRDYEHIELV